jgi:hypothetical protein
MEIPSVKNKDNCKMISLLLTISVVVRNQALYLNGKELPGWTATIKTRRDGKHKDSYYRAPNGKQYRSMKEVLRTLKN